MTKTRLPRTLGPRAKKKLLTQPDECVQVLVEYGPATDTAALAAGIEAFGGKVLSNAEEARLLTVEIQAGRLAELAGLDGVVTVEASAAYRP